MTEQEQIDELTDLWQQGQDMSCACHVNPPCTACVDFGHGIELAEFIQVNSNGS